MTHGSLKSLSSFFCITESQLGTYPGETAAELIALSAAEGQTQIPDQSKDSSPRTWRAAGPEFSRILAVGPQCSEHAKMHLWVSSQ